MHTLKRKDILKEKNPKPTTQNDDLHEEKKLKLTSIYLRKMFELLSKLVTLFLACCHRDVLFCDLWGVLFSQMEKCRLHFGS